jgi:hypothetical protein
MKLRDQDRQTAPRFSRRWWIATGRTAFWVVVVTVLIWVYGDMEVTDTEEFTALVRLFVADRDRLVMLSDDCREMPDPKLKITFNARTSRSNLAALKQRLDGPGPHLAYEVSQGREAGRYTIAADEILRTMPDVRKLGVSILSARPGEVAVWLDDVETHAVRVDVQFAGGQVAESPKDLQANVIISRLCWEQLRESAPAAGLAVRTQPVDLSALEPGETATFEAELVGAIGGVSVRLEETSVGVKVKKASSARQLDETTIRVPVSVQFPPEWIKRGIWKTHKFETREETWSRQQITVEGPKAEITGLRSQDVYAYIVLNDGDEKTPTWWAKEIQVRFPPGSNLRLKQVPKVEFRMLPAQP